MDALKSVVLLGILLAAVGCDRVTGDATAAKAAVKRFHSQLNGERYEAIIHGATAGFRTAATREERYAYFDGVAWRHELIDSGEGAYGLSIAFDPITGQPTVAYGRGHLLFARRHGPDDWTSEVVDSKTWDDLDHRSLAYDLDGNPTIAYTGKERTILYCVVSRSEVNPLKQLVHETDPDAFMVIGNVHEALGEGFRPLIE